MWESEPLSFLFLALGNTAQEMGAGKSAAKQQTGLIAKVSSNPQLTRSILFFLLVIFSIIPWFVSTYQTNILISFLLYG